MFQSRGEKDRCKAVKNQGGAGTQNTSSQVFLLKQQGGSHFQTRSRQGRV